ncbi:PRC-barrel domain-containing protein [Paraburkholderia caribensis]|uniref:PRC-barrel domain-containing protein n=1 Tax=Paraburkholderia caribensis TaxID=75105 RepID=UPI0009E83876|nr:PRC-barrel domain-containing protein [Paraburkholderia caribensis]
MNAKIEKATRILSVLFAVTTTMFPAGLAIGQQSEAPIAGAVPLGVSVTQTQLVAKGWRASKLVHTDVYNEKNEKIGRVDDMIVAPDGSLSVAIIDVGGFLGIAAHRVAIPVQRFKQISPKMILDGASKDALSKLPEFEYAKG